MRLGSLGNFSIFQDQQGAIEGLITVGFAKIGTTRPVLLVEDKPRHCPSPALLFAPISPGLQHLPACLPMASASLSPYGLIHPHPLSDFLLRAFSHSLQTLRMPLVQPTSIRHLLYTRCFTFTIMLSSFNNPTMKA